MPTNYTVKKITIRSQDVLVSAVNMSRPKTEDDYFHAAECRTALKDLVADRKMVRELDGSTYFEFVLKSPENDILLSESAFRFLERALKEAMEGGQVFRGAHAENVVEAIKVMKSAANGAGSSEDTKEKKQA